jgi:hypothetical protein
MKTVFILYAITASSLFLTQCWSASSLGRKAIDGAVGVALAVLAGLVVFWGE